MAWQGMNTIFTTSQFYILTSIILIPMIFSVSQTDWTGGDSYYSSLEEGMYHSTLRSKFSYRFDDA